MVAGDTVDVRVANLPDFVGPARFTKDRMYESTPAGTVAGLAWTSMGGATLYVETALEGTQEGKGQLKVTGNLKDVMRGTTLNLTFLSITKEFKSLALLDFLSIAPPI